jgi:hypothetical protein
MYSYRATSLQLIVGMADWKLGSLLVVDRAFMKELW